jgi:16S rRNA (uracil1498-N3)-methyltransferase
MARYDFTTPRLFVRSELAAGRAIALDVKQANYIKNVLRLRPGAAVQLFNGRDGEWRAAVAAAAAGRREVSLTCEEMLRRQEPLPSLSYLFAPLRQARLDYMVEKAVEMGAGRLVPVVTRHTQVRAVNAERLFAHVVEACEQCGVIAVPAIGPLTPFPDLMAAWCEPAEGRVLVVADEAESREPRDPLAALAGIGGRDVALLIGPEGGFAAEERAAFRAVPGVVILPLGPRILRADTAAVAALALVQAVAGDWRGAPA